MKSKKITLHAVGNERDFNYYVFDKKKEIYFAVSKLLREIMNLYLESYDAHDKEINIEKYKDQHNSTIHVRINSRCDIFYGDKRMFFVIHCPEKLRQKFNEELFKIANMSKPTKINKIKPKK